LIWPFFSQLCFEVGAAEEIGNTNEVKAKEMALTQISGWRALLMSPLYAKKRPELPGYV